MTDIEDMAMQSPDKGSVLIETDETSAIGTPGRRSAAFTKKCLDNAQIEKSFRSSNLAKERKSAKEQMFNECSFTPTTKGLPRSYGPNKTAGTLVYNRLTKWERNRAVEMKQKRVLRAHEEVKHCTFKPQINKQPTRQIGQKHATVRLYEDSALMAMNKARLAEELRAKEIEKETKECSFHPKLDTRRSAWSKVEPKYNQPQNSITADDLPDKENYTFTPHVNSISNNTITAQVYCRQNVVERLTAKPSSSDAKKKTSAYKEQRTIIDLSTFLSGAESIESTSKDEEASPCKPEVTDQTPPIMTEAERERRKENFNAFLIRQHSAQEKKKIQMQELEKALFQQQKFVISEESKKIIQNSQRGEFMDRLKHDVEARRDRKKSHPLDAEEFTFKPKLNKTRAASAGPRVSKQRNSTTNVKETTVQTKTSCNAVDTNGKNIKQPYYRDRHSGTTSKIDDSHQSKNKVKLAVNPDIFFERHKKTLEKKNILKEKVMAERAEREMVECTFAPQIKECPKFVSNIARSISIVKSIRAPHADSSNPEWR